MKISTLALCVSLLSLASCATPKFNHQWEAALASSDPPYTDITGPWEGTWESGHNKHTGKLRCIVSEGEGENDYTFDYWATWGPGMKGKFRFDGTGEQVGNAVKVTGSKRLGPTKYNHKATITPTSFTSEFGSDKKNFGVMELQRPE